SRSSPAKAAMEPSCCLTSQVSTRPRITAATPPSQSGVPEITSSAVAHPALGAGAGRFVERSLRSVGLALLGRWRLLSGVLREHLAGNDRRRNRQGENRQSNGGGGQEPSGFHIILPLKTRRS